MKFKNIFFIGFLIFSGTVIAENDSSNKNTDDFLKKKTSEKIVELYDSINEYNFNIKEFISDKEKFQADIKNNIEKNKEAIFLSNDYLEKLKLAVSGQEKDSKNIKSIVSEILEKNTTQEEVLNELIASVEKKYLELNSIIESQGENLKELNLLFEENKLSVEEKSKYLLGEIESTQQEVSTSVSALDKNLKTNSTYWTSVMTVFFVLLLAIAWLLYRRIGKNKNDIETQIKSTRQSLEEEGLKLDHKLIEIFESQLKIKDEIKESSVSIQTEEIDHSLALKVADEIVRMQKNIARIDEGTKGLNPLIKGIERIRANFASNDYEMITYFNEEYEERMNIDVLGFIEDASLDVGVKLITKVIKPQVNYKNVLIQRAQVEISQN